MKSLALYRTLSLAILSMLGASLSTMAGNELVTTPPDALEGANTLSISGSSESLPSVVQEAFLKQLSPEAAELSGYAVALSGDTAVVGAPFKDAKGADSGAVYVYIRGDKGWFQQALLKPNNAGAGDRFGCSVAIDGDRILVGAENENTDCSGVNCSGRKLVNGTRGAAYLFKRQGTNWNQEAFLKPSNTGASDHFGHAVAISRETLVVGAYLEDSSSTQINKGSADDGAENSGAAYVFVLQNGGWVQQAYLKSFNSTADDQFGTSVSISEDTIVIGAPLEDSRATGINGNAADNGALQSGAVYVFVRIGTNWLPQAYVKASNTANGDLFGTSVSVSGNTMVIGAPGETSRGVGVDGSSQNNYVNSTGAAYVFTRDGTNWSQQAYLKASNTDVDDRFGYAVGVQGDLIAVGAWHEDSVGRGIDADQRINGLTDSGAAYVFARRGKTWTQENYLKASNPNKATYFGYAVAVAEDRVLVGSFGNGSNSVDGDDTAVPNSGAGYLFAGFCPVCPRLNLATTPKGTASIHVIGIPGSAYNLEQAVNINGPWETIGTLLISVSGFSNYEDLLAPASQKYYRLESF